MPTGFTSIIGNLVIILEINEDNDTSLKIIEFHLGEVTISKYTSALGIIAIIVVTSNIVLIILKNLGDLELSLMRISFKNSRFIVFIVYLIFTTLNRGFSIS